MWPIWCSFSMACLQSSPMKDHIVLSDTTSYIIRDRTEKNNELRLRARKVVCHWSKNGYNAPRRKSQDQQKSAYISDIFKTHDISFEQSQKKPCAYGWDEAFAVVYSKISHAQLIAACKVEQNDLPNPYFCPYLRRLVEFVNRQKGRRWKVVHPPKTLTKRGPLLVVNHEVFGVHVVVVINPTAQSDVCAATVHYSLHIHHHCTRSLYLELPFGSEPGIRTAIRPPACGTSTLLSKKPNVRVTCLICPPRACDVFHPRRAS